MKSVITLFIWSLIIIIYEMLCLKKFMRCIKSCINKLHRAAYYCLLEVTFWEEICDQNIIDYAVISISESEM